MLRKTKSKRCNRFQTDALILARMLFYRKKLSVFRYCYWYKYNKRGPDILSIASRSPVKKSIERNKCSFLKKDVKNNDLTVFFTVYYENFIFFNVIVVRLFLRFVFFIGHDRRLLVSILSFQYAKLFFILSLFRSYGLDCKILPREVRNIIKMLSNIRRPFYFFNLKTTILKVSQKNNSIYHNDSFQILDHFCIVPA